MSELVFYNGAYTGPQVDAAISRALSGGALDQRIDAVAASPLVASTAADMSDQTRIYVYTGSETGYTAGDWYYWDGSAWTSGGTYQAASADAALSDVSVNPVQNRIVTGAVTALQAGVLGSYAKGTESGAMASFDDGADDIPVADLTATLDYNAAGYTDVTVTQTGKNIMAESFVPYVPSGTWNPADTFLIKAGTYFLSGAIANAATWRLGIKVLAADGTAVGNDTSYRPTYDGTPLSWNSSRSLWGFGADTSAASLSYIIAFPKDCLVRFGLFAGGTSASTTVSDAQLEAGAAATAYEAYTGETYTVDLTGVGATIYGGTMDYTTGILTSEYAADGTLLSPAVTYTLDAVEVNTTLGDNNFFADSGDISVIYRRDPTIAYNNIVNAIISLGGNV